MTMIRKNSSDKKTPNCIFLQILTTKFAKMLTLISRKSKNFFPLESPDLLRVFFLSLYIKLFLQWCLFVYISLSFLIAVCVLLLQLRLFVHLHFPMLMHLSIRAFICLGTVNRRKMFFKIIADGWIQTRVLWFQLCHNKCAPF